MIDINTANAQTIRSLVRDDVSFRKDFLHAIRRLFANGREAAFQGWGIEASDEELFRFARLKSNPRSDVTTEEKKAEREFHDWNYRRTAPLHLCEHYLTALRERETPVSSS